MALIQGYEYDIFISYAHVDDLKFPGQEDGWIKQFYTSLNLMLAKRFGRLDSVKIWWDNRKLDGATAFNQSIETGIEKSALMICLYSPGYIASEYCNQELETFYKKAALERVGLKIGDRSRILNVLLNNIPFDKWRPELSGISGFFFNDGKVKNNYGDPYDPVSPEYKTELENLRDSIFQLLTDFAKINNVNDLDNIPEPKDDVFTIYMGEVADTLRASRKRIIVELEKKGYTVQEGIPPPYEAIAHEQSTIKALKHSDLAINLMDEYAGREIEGLSEMWYPLKQTELTLESDKSQMIWLPSDIDFENVEEEKYKTFLKNLDEGKDINKAFEFIRVSKSMLAQEIINYTEQMKAKQTGNRADRGKLSVLLDTHFKDKSYATELSNTLIRNEISTFVNPQEDDPRKNINILGDRLSQVRKLIFLYGTVSREWVLERMSAALQLIIANNYPIEDFFIYMAPPHKEANSIQLNQRFLKVNIIDSSNNLVADKATIEKFLSELKTDNNL